MAEVPGSPYEPFFTAQPTERPIQLRGVDAPGAAFGENIANAVRTFGGDVEQASGEVFNRALALRRLQIEGNLRDLTTQYYNEVAPIQEKFLTAQGMDASQDAMNAHLANIESIRQKYAAQAEQYGPYGRNVFGNEAASFQRNFTVNATRWSAEQTRKAQENSIDSAIAVEHNNMRGQQSQADRDKSIARLGYLERLRGGIYGSSEDAVASRTFDTTSGGILESTKGAQLRDPANATTAGQAALDSGRLNSADQDKLIQHTNAVAPGGARAWLTGVRGGQILTLGERKIDPDALVSTVQRIEGSGRGPEITNPRSQYYGQRALPGGVMPGNLAPWLKEAGMPSMTEEEYANNPDAQRQLMRFKLNQYQEKYGSFNDAVAAWFTGKPLTPDTLEKTDYQPGSYRGMSGLSYLRSANQTLAQTMAPGQLIGAAEAEGNARTTPAFPNTGEIWREAAATNIDQENHRNYYQKVYTLRQMEDQITQGNPQTKAPYNDMEEFRSNPQNAQFIEQGRAVYPDFDQRMNRAIIGYQKTFLTATDQQHKYDLTAMAHDDPQKFMETDIAGDSKLSWQDKAHFGNMKAQLLKQGYIDPNVNRAMGYLAGKFANEVPNKQTDPTGYATYKGRLFDAIQGWETEQKKPLRLGTPEGNKALDEIHEYLYSKGPGWFARRQYLTEPEIDDEFAKMVRQQDPEATDDMVRYYRIKGDAIDHFDKLYGSEGAKRARTAMRFRPGYQPPSPPPTTSPVTAPTAPQPPAPTEFQESQADPVIKFLQRIGGDAIHKWLEQKAGEATQAYEGMESAAAAENERRKRELPPEVIGQERK